VDPDGHVGGPPAIIECADDHAAIEAAKALVNGNAIEVWDRMRRVIRLEPKRE
jgi:hypothetical protein